MTCACCAPAVVLCCCVVYGHTCLKSYHHHIYTSSSAVQRMDELMGNVSTDPSSSSEQQKQQRQAMETQLMSVEISLLFSGFEKLDQNHDGFLSPTDLVRFCKQFQVKLRGRDLSAMLWLMDDSRRGKLTFDDVMKGYIRNREEFLRSGADFHRQEEVKTPQEKEKSKVIQTGFGAFGVENEQAKLRYLDGGTGGSLDLDSGVSLSSPGKRRRDMERLMEQKMKQKQTQKKKFLDRHRRFSSASTSSGGRGSSRGGKGEEEVTVTSDDFRSQPLLLIRVLFFVAMQDSKGEIHLLSAFQSLSQLFNSVRGAAEEKFNCIFLQDCLEIQDADRVSLAGFVEHLKQQKLAVKRVRLQANCFK